MSILTVNNLEKWYGVQQLFKNVNFEISDGDRVALIGNNGEGKTTLLNIIMGEEDYDSGDVFISKNKTVGILNQTVGLENQSTLYEQMLSSFEDLFRLKSKIKECEELLGKEEIYLYEDKLDKVMKKYGKLTEIYEMNGGYDIDTRINKVLFGLGFDERQFSQIVETFSGGEKTKIKLAKLLVYNPDLLLLDEPTNHLDIDTIEWFEKYITNYKGAILLVSHDRHFMDKAVNKVYELKNCKLKEYNGNYSRFTRLKKTEIEQQRKEYINIEKERKRLERQIDTFKRHKKFSQIRNREKMLENIKDIEMPKEDKKIKFHITTNSNKIGRILRVKELGKSFGKKRLFADINFEINWGEKVAILGSNGVGKSTFLKILTGLEEPTSGFIKFDKDVKLGYFAQEHDDLNEQFTLLEEIRYKLGLSNFESRRLLAQFMFYEDDVKKKIKSLSGGERSRVVFAKLIASDLNILVMDEPTNHLDINSREVLENALLEFKGTLIFVSHDRYFVSKIADKIIKFSCGQIEEKKIRKLNDDTRIIAQ